MPWIRIRGKAERYRNTETNNEISRYMYDKLYGKLIGQGFRSYRQKAKVNREKNIAEALARPARGRRSIRRESEAVKAARVIEYRLEQQEKKQRRAKRKYSGDRLKLPPGKRGIRLSLPFDLDEIWKILNKAAATRGVIGAGVGIDGVDAGSEQPLSITVYGAFLMDDYRRNPSRVQARITAALSEKLHNTTYLIPNGYFVWVTWAIDWLRRYRHWK